MKNFLIVDDHAIVRSGIIDLLSELFKDCRTFEAYDGNTALEMLKQHAYDLIIMDIRMPKTDSIGLMEFISSNYPGTKVLIFSMNSEKIYAARFLKAGAKGFITKDASREEMYKAINLILANRKYISESLAESLAEPDSNIGGNPFQKLSKREFEIISFLLLGQNTNEISVATNTQASTIATYKKRAFDKLKITNIIELKELAMSYNL